METFRRMLNDCIRIGLEENKTSFLSLRYACYPKLKDYKIVSAYKNNAISRADWNLVKLQEAREEEGKDESESRTAGNRSDDLLRIQTERWFNSISFQDWKFL